MSSRRRVLVIDDEEVILAAARRILRAEGFEAVTAPDAEAGMAVLREAPTDVAVVDLKLPGLSGLDFLEAAQRDFPGVVVIIMTGYAGVESAVASLKRGAFDFLPKPFTFDELLSPVCRASRFLERPPPAPLPDGPPRGYAFLGTHGWAKPVDGGNVLVGLAPVLVRTIGPVARIVLPEPDLQLQQGGPLARIVADDNLEHVVWSPVSGRVMALNDALRTDPTALTGDPLGDGWIARVFDANMERELRNLSHPPA